MGTLTLVLWLAIAVLVSAVIDQIVPRISLPLIQVVMGAAIAVVAGRAVDVNLDPDLFLVLFIAPLLYLEAKDADKALLWRNRKPILSLAIGLVVVSTLCIGFVVNGLVPSISLAAAFALGAALGPTDAVAVTSLSKSVTLPQRQWGILKGELLLNDASGIVSFQFALAAATTGVFSLLDAGVAFVVEFVGGLLFGLACGYVANFALRRIRDLGIESTTFHVLFEVCIPFVVYLASNAIHVSGIIAVVVAGLVNVIAPRTVSPSIAHMNIVSSSVWQVLAFALNGIVFVMLGTQIPTAMYYSWESPDVDNAMLVLYVLAITFVLMAVRFAWCFAMEAVHVKKGEMRPLKGSDVRNALLLALCGSKGTITLSILFTIPFFVSTGQMFPQRSLIIFLGCGVILCTLLIANFVVPQVCPKRARKQTELEAKRNYYGVLRDILRNVIEELTAQQTPTNRRASRNVIKAYQDRLSNTSEHIDDADEASSNLRRESLQWEQERTLSMIEEGVVSRDVGFDWLRRLERMETLASVGKDRNLVRRLLVGTRLALVQAKHALASRFDSPTKESSRREEMRGLQLQTAEWAAGILRGLVAGDDVRTEDASRLLLGYEQRISILRGSSRSLTTSFRIADESDDILRLAYQLELEQIQKAYEQDRITRQEAGRMRDNVFMMQMDLEDKL